VRSRLLWRLWLEAVRDRKRHLEVGVLIEQVHERRSIGPIAEPFARSNGLDTAAQDRENDGERDRPGRDPDIRVELDPSGHETGDRARQRQHCRTLRVDRVGRR
jgi:hypothetical protein